MLVLPPPAIFFRASTRCNDFTFTNQSVTRLHIPHHVMLMKGKGVVTTFIEIHERRIAIIVFSNYMIWGRVSFTWLNRQMRIKEE